MKYELVGHIVLKNFNQIKQHALPHQSINADFFAPINEDWLGGNGRFEIRDIPMPLNYSAKLGGVVKITVETIE